jgi:hypothetical protein
MLRMVLIRPRSLLFSSPAREFAGAIVLSSSLTTVAEQRFVSR